jgi:hypothetical protein
VSGADTDLYSAPQVLIDIAPEVECALEHGLGDPVEQVADDIADESIRRGDGCRPGASATG